MYALEQKILGRFTANCPERYRSRAYATCVEDSREMISWAGHEFDISYSDIIIQMKITYVTIKMRCIPISEIPYESLYLSLLFSETLSKAMDTSKLRPVMTWVTWRGLQVQ